MRWPVRSPDLSRLDFYFWGHIKMLLSDTPIENGEELVERIAEAAEEIRDMPIVCQNVWISMPRRLRSAL